MQQAFGTVVWIVCVVGVLAGLVGLFVSRKTWEDYGRHHLVRDSDQAPAPASGSAAALQERDMEVRQLLEARNALRARRGEPLLDLDHEVARLAPPQIDSELRAEIRDLVHARNHRRVRAGKPPLDVDTEIEREIAGLTGI